MIRIKVQYDALNRTFKLLDTEFKTILEGDGLYDLTYQSCMKKPTWRSLFRREMYLSRTRNRR